MATILAVQPISKVAAQDLVRDLDLTDDEVHLSAGPGGQGEAHAGASMRASLSGKYISLLFEKPSLRTRLTFELAIKQLGGDAVTCEGPVGAREPLKDVARNLERWVQGIVARTFSQSTIEELAHWSSAPVINALSDLYHPCQALADVFTLREQFGELRGLKLAFVGDGNNVAHSLMLTAVRLGMDFAHRHARGLCAECGDRRRRPRGWRQSPARGSKSRTTPQRPSTARTRCTPMSGPAWGRRRNRPSGGSTLPGTR